MIYYIRTPKCLRTSVKQLRDVCDAYAAHHLLLIALRLLFVLAKIKQVIRAQTRRSDITCFGFGVAETFISTAFNEITNK